MKKIILGSALFSLIVLGIMCVFVILMNIALGTDVLHERYNIGDDFLGGSINGTCWLAQTFTVGSSGTNESHRMTSVKLKLFRVGLPGTGLITIRATDGAGEPSGINLTNGTINGNSLTTSTNGAWYEIVLTPYYILMGTKYAIQLQSLNGSYENTIRWRIDQSTPTYAGGNYFHSITSGVTWTTYGYDRDFMFEEYGQTIVNITNPTPANQSTYVTLMPRCTITINNLNGNPMNLYWYENSTGPYILRQTNSTCVNGTYSWIDAQATSYHTKYYRKICCNDSVTVINVSVIYNFKTEYAPPSNPTKYVIITDGIYQDEFHNLTDWKESRGVLTDLTNITTHIEVVSTIVLNNSFWATGYWGDASNDTNPWMNGYANVSNITMFNDTQCKIRNYMRYCITNLSTQYIVFGGDNSVIPYRYFNWGYSNGDDEGYTDSYYMYLNGSWNENEDVYWGEVSEWNDDIVADVSLGRIPSESKQQVNWYVEKVKIIENLSADSEFWRHGLLGCDATYGNVRRYSMPFAAQHKNMTWQQMDTGEFKEMSLVYGAIWETYNPSFLYYNDHGGGGQFAWWIYTTPMNNPLPWLGIADQCKAGELYPWVGLNHLCAPELVNLEHGAIGIVAPITKIYPDGSWTQPLFDNILEGNKGLGDSLKDTKNQYTDGLSRIVFNLLGDPEIMWRASDSANAYLEQNLNLLHTPTYTSDYINGTANGTGFVNYTIELGKWNYAFCVTGGDTHKRDILYPADFQLTYNVVDWTTEGIELTNGGMQQVNGTGCLAMWNWSKVNTSSFIQNYTHVLRLTVNNIDGTVTQAFKYFVLWYKPSFTNLSIINISHAFIINWDSYIHNSKNRIEYGSSGHYGNWSNWYNTTNGSVSITLTGLESDTDYSLKLHSINSQKPTFNSISYETATTSPSPVLSNEIPLNASIGILSTTTLLEITIRDPNGDSFDWTIECSTDDNNSGIGASNGTKNCSLSGLSDGTLYYWWVNVTDGTWWTNETYHFTTASTIVVSPGGGDGDGGTTFGTLRLNLKGESADIKIYQGTILRYAKSNMARDSSFNWTNVLPGTYKIVAEGTTSGVTIEKTVTIVTAATTNVIIEMKSNGIPGFEFIILLGAMFLTIVFFRRKK